MKVHCQAIHAEAQGFMNSSRSCSPGCMGFSFFAMVFFIRNFEVYTAGGILRLRGRAATLLTRESS